MKRKKTPKQQKAMKFLAITCFSIATLQLAVVITSDLTRESDDLYSEIASCKTEQPPTFATASLVSSSQPVQDDGSADQEFVLQAADAGRAEVALGQLASDKASSGAVKDFAKMMVDDHTKANDELKAMAQKKGITIPADCKMCQEKLSQLQNLNGKEFDQKYSEMMVADHKEVISKFSRESSQGKDNDLKKWAGDKLPTLQHHLSAAGNLKP